MRVLMVLQIPADLSLYATLRWSVHLKLGTDWTRSWQAPHAQPLSWICIYTHRQFHSQPLPSLSWPTAHLPIDCLPIYLDANWLKVAETPHDPISTCHREYYWQDTLETGCLAHFSKHHVSVVSAQSLTAVWGLRNGREEMAREGQPSLSLSLSLDHFYMFRFYVSMTACFGIRIVYL